MQEGSGQNLEGKPIDTSLDDSSANKNFQPGGGNPEEEAGSAEPEQKPDFSPDEEAWFKNRVPQDQLDANQQELIARNLANQAQQRLIQIARERRAAEEQLSELEKNLTKFQSSKLGGFFSIFQPKIKQLINTILAEMQKGARNLSDKQKVGYYRGLITYAGSLIGILSALKMVAAVIDATFSWLTKAIPSCVTCIGCIFFFIIAPIYIPFFALIFMLGAIPLMKGKLTKIDADIIKDLKKQKTAWEAELKVLRKKVNLREKIRALYSAEKNVKRQK